MKRELSYHEALEVLKTTLANGGYSHKVYSRGFTRRKIDIFDTHFYDIIFVIQEFYEVYGTINTWLDGHILHLKQ